MTFDTYMNCLISTIRLQHDLFIQMNSGRIKFK